MLLCVLDDCESHYYGVRSSVVTVGFEAMARFQPPAAFNFSSPDRWPAWKLRFSRFRMAAKLSIETEEIQVSTLLYSLGPDADPVFEYQLGLSDADKRKYAEVVEAFDTYFRPATNVVHERAQFEQLIQRPGQTLEEFVRDLYKGAEFCDFGGEKDNRIRDRIVAHMSNKRVSREIQMKEASEQTLAKALTYARQAEKVEDQVAAQGRSAAASSVSEPVSSSAVSHRPGNSGRKQPTQQQPNSGARGECLNCDRAHAQGKCPARGKSCNVNACGPNARYPMSPSLHQCVTVTVKLYSSFLLSQVGLLHRGLLMCELETTLFYSSWTQARMLQRCHSFKRLSPTPRLSASTAPFSYVALMITSYLFMAFSQHTAHIATYPQTFLCMSWKELPLAS